MILPNEQTEGIIASNVFKMILLVLWLVFGGWVYAGFYQVDPFLFTGGSRSGLRSILFLARIIFPVIWIGLAYLGFLIARGKVKGDNVLLLGMGTAFSLFLVYFCALHYYYMFSSANSLENLHPYLQLSPPTVELREKQSTKPTARIFFAGGSSTDWPDSQGRGWPDYVEEHLENQTNFEVQSYNVAQEWYNTQHTLINYSVNLRKLKPDYFVVMNVINDFMVNADFSWISKGVFQEDYGHWPGPLARIIKRQSIFNAVSDKFAGAWYYKSRKLLDQHEFPGIAVYKEKLHDIIHVLRADGVIPVLMTEPYLYRVDLSEKERSSLTMLNFTTVGKEVGWSLQTAVSGMQQFSDAMREVARENNVELIDLEAAIPKDSKYLRDDCHYKDEAFPLISENVSEGIKKILSQR